MKKSRFTETQIIATLMEADSGMLIKGHQRNRGLEIWESSRMMEGGNSGC